MTTKWARWLCSIPLASEQSTQRSGHQRWVSLHLILRDIFPCSEIRFSSFSFSEWTSKMTLAMLDWPYDDFREAKEVWPCVQCGEGWGRQRRICKQWILIVQVLPHCLADGLDSDIGFAKEYKRVQMLTYRLHLCKKEVAPHRKTQSLYVDDKQERLPSICKWISSILLFEQVSSLTNLVVGVTAPVKRCQIFQLHSWQGRIQFFSKDLSRRNISECSDSMVKGKFWAAMLLKTNFPFHNTCFCFPKMYICQS